MRVVENFHIKVYLIGIPIIDYLIEDDYVYCLDSIQQPLLISGYTVDGTGTSSSRYQPISTPTEWQRIVQKPSISSIPLWEYSVSSTDMSAASLALLSDGCKRQKLFFHKLFSWYINSR
ncbi:MAG: hypothetical protein IPJ86_14435 [Bacteroidetes bacterium]|nr:hypothetical protein [Bacteroidota bacterium]